MKFNRDYNSLAHSNSGTISDHNLVFMGSANAERLLSRECSAKNNDMPSACKKLRGRIPAEFLQNSCRLRLAKGFCLNLRHHHTALAVRQHSGLQTISAKYRYHCDMMLSCKEYFTSHTQILARSSRSDNDDEHHHPKETERDYNITLPLFAE